MNNCAKKFEQNMLGFFPYCPDDIKFAVAVSGGSDSMCMLELARIWAQNTKAKIFVVVIDHGMRQFNSEINLIEDFCKKK
jgi:tRNA(Ile)-lysidine synthase TilS/MesJ